MQNSLRKEKRRPPVWEQLWGRVSGTKEHSQPDKSKWWQLLFSDHYFWAITLLKRTKRRAICSFWGFFLMVSTIWSKRSKIILWVSKSISRLRLTHWGDFGGYTKRYGVDFQAGKFTFRRLKKMNFFKFFKLPKFPWILQICMLSTFETYDDF